MMLSILQSDHPFSQKICKAFQEGCNDSEIIRANEFEFGNCAGYGILRGTGEAYKRANHFIYIDHVYWEQWSIREKSWEDAYFRVVVDGFWHPSKPDESDWMKYYKLNPGMAPWRTKGEHILLIPPSRHMERYWGLEDWLDDTTDNLRKITDREIKVSIKGDERLPDILDNSHCVVSDHSNGGIYALSRGIPVIYTHPQRRLGDIRDIENPPMDRSFFSRLANGCFNLDEIRNGQAWTYCQSILDLTEER